MSRRLSYAEKGKGVARLSSPPRSGRVKVATFDTSELRKKHELTLIGRVTNPKAQRMWSLIPFLADHWKCRRRPTGSDLGQGKFQFQFESLDDLQMVLDNRPYHFAKWMLIIQRWEPTLSPAFPSLIPFWIEIQGVPLHLWDDTIIRGIGEDIGLVENWEITPTKARLRTQVNGLLPLITSSTLEFDNGDEVIATLLYEKLEKHCKICLMLDHELEDCPQNPQQKDNNNKKSNIQTEGKNEEFSKGRRTYQDNPHQAKESSRHQDGFMRDARKSANFEPPRERRSQESQGRHQHSRSYYRPESYHSHQHLSPRYDAAVARKPRWVETGRRVSPSVHTRTREELQTNSVTRERRTTLEDRNSSAYISGHRPITELNSLERRQGKGETFVVPTHEEAVEAARLEIREALNQYANCADPTESAARRERVRLAEETGEVDANANSIAADTINILPVCNQSESIEYLENTTRIPALLRLQNPVDIGTSEPRTEEERIPVKKRLGRPPLNKNQPKPLGVRTTTAATKRRTVAQLRISPKRKAPPSSSTRGVKARSKEPTGQANDTTANSQPKSLIVPGISKKKVDFHNLPAPVP